MAVSPDDRFAGLISASAERGGWVPGDVVTADDHGEEEPVPARRTRLPVLVALAVLTAAVLVAAFLVLRPVDRQSSVGQPAGAPVSEGAGAVPSGGAAAGQGTGQAEGHGADQAAAGKPSGTVTVHVTGQVRDPGVVTLDAGSRIHDAVEAAGGLGSAADAEAVNLARVLVDGEQIHIPKPGERVSDRGGDAAAGQGTGADGGQGAGGQDASGAGSSGPGPGPTGADPEGAAAKIDLNSADATALQTLPGVGPVTAEAIIAHRQTQPFTSVEDLLLVHGIGPKTYERLKDLVTVG
ncbi:competence protein ComEA [Brevibacterium sanguinis]|uniref:Competence protein ComEA n=2 Tax=Brevibacterium TaxID=1696 RepID=A0A366IGS5_9MICO|nr:MULTISPECIES: ComEA family DNA-binding protein [Brevibacterium]RBP63947.1 competence protein ComEA [Brevibacterium sanguinis]RBP70778.1 competence protein ComEA [Brevibacterium celere]